MEEPNNQNQSTDSLVMPDLASVSNKPQKNDSPSDQNSASPAAHPENTNQNPLDGYFNHGNQEAEEPTTPQPTPASPTSTNPPVDNSQSQPPVSQDAPNPPPAAPISPAQPVPAEKPKPDPNNPIIIEQNKAKRKQIIKWVVVILNFSITAFLIYYYFYMSKK